MEKKQVPPRDVAYEAISFYITATWEVSMELVAQKNPPSTLCLSFIETCNPRTCLDWSELGALEATFPCGNIKNDFSSEFLLRSIITRTPLTKEYHRLEAGF